MQPPRVDMILARFGYCSRREALRWLRSGRVTTTSGVVLRDPAQRIPPELLRVNGEAIEHPNGLLVLMHKPLNTVCSHNPADGPRVFDLLPPRWMARQPQLNTIGRLDRDTSGVLLITDLGRLIHHLISPKSNIEKVYEVQTESDIPPSVAEIFAAGTLCLAGEDKPCLPARLEQLEPRVARLTLTEGRYHQVRRMLASQGLRVVALHRVRFGEWDLKNLRPGEFLPLPLPEGMSVWDD